jgi:hypothetical protein
VPGSAYFSECEHCIYGQFFRSREDDQRASRGNKFGDEYLNKMNKKAIFLTKIHMIGLKSRKIHIFLDVLDNFHKESVP